MSLPTFDLPRACRFSRVDWDWAAASLSLQQRLLLTFQDQDLPFVSSHHNTALSRTHPSSRPTQLPRADSKTCRDSSTSCLEYILPPLTLHIIAIPPYTTPLFPRICHPEIAACDDPTSLWPTQSPPPPLVRPDDRRIVYFITAHQTINILHKYHTLDNSTTIHPPQCPLCATRFASRTRTLGRPRASSRRPPTMFPPHQSQSTWPKSRPQSTSSVVCSHCANGSPHRID